MTTAEARTRLHDLVESLPSNDVPTAIQNIDPPEYRLRVGKWRVRFRLDHDRRTMSILHVLRRDDAD